MDADPVGRLRSWFRELGTAPAPLTKRERWLVMGVGAVVIVTRWFAVAKTPWDWDEMLFILAMRDYDVAAHHPHPPGFPLFIGFAKLLRFLIEDDFRALQAVTFLGAALVFRALFFLARELRVDFATSLSAALLLAMFPNVLFFGGTAFSDVLSLALVVLACALLLRGVRDGRAYLAGAIVLGVAAGFRPQNLLIGLVPALIATLAQWKLARARVIAAIILGGAILAISYGVAIDLTGAERYREAVAVHRAYITSTDSFLAPTRRPLWRLFDEFFIRPYRQGILNALIALLVFIGVARWRDAAPIVLLTFGPFCLFAWLFLDHHSASRFSIAYMPLFALFAAEGLRILKRWQLAAAAAIAMAMFAWSLPGLLIAHRTASPPIRAVEWVQENVSLKNSTLYVDRELLPFFEAFAPAWPTITAPRGTTVVPWTEQTHAYLIAERAGELTFSRGKGRLWDIARRRYFTVSITTLDERVQFADGWQKQEGRPPFAFRMMRSPSIARLPAIGGKGRLAFSLRRGESDIAVFLNGVRVAPPRIEGAYADAEYLIDATQPIELRIETKTPETLRLEWLEWSRFGVR